MQRVLVPLACVALLACEDGPTQIYNPSPPGAGDHWNDGRTPGSVDTAKQPFVTDVGGQNQMEICPGPQKAARWAQMVKEPILPPRQAAGIDLAGGDSWTGITIEQAEQINCQSTNLGDAFGDGSQTNYWGDNGEVWFVYRVSTHKGIWMTLWPGYLGTVTAKSPDDQHTYNIPIQSQIQKDGKAFTLDWISNKGADFEQQSDELYRALLHTFAPGLPLDPPGVTCQSTGRCIKGSFGDVAYFYIPAIGWALWIDNQNAPQPTPSIPTRMDQNLAKLMPYAFANPQLKMDAEGPVAHAGTLGKAQAQCDLKLGLTYQDFLNTCVEVTGDMQKDKTEQNKLLGGLTHSTERFFFDVQGVDIEFTDQDLPATDIIHDNDIPTANDTSTEWVVDQSTLGNILNDFDGNGNLDLHGAGAVQKEYLRLVRTTLLQETGIPDGDVSKCVWPSPLPKNFDAKAFQANLPAYCTGFEGMVTAAPPTRFADPNNLGLNALKVTPQYALGLKLGHEKVAFCWDANGDVQTGYKNCDVGDTFSTSFNRVLTIFAKNKLANLPTNCQDVRFFFRQWVIALLKYMQVGDRNPVPDISNNIVDPNNLFFDSEGSGQFELAEYVDRRFVTQSVDPTDFQLVADVKNGIFDEYDFSRDLMRGESAVYAAIRENPNDGLGKEDNALLTNIFGSPALKSGWHDSSKGKSAYYCATTIDPANCDGQLPPLDDNGQLLVDELNRPILAPYKGAFGSTAFTLGVTPVKVTQTMDNIQQAMVRVPIHLDPYDSASQLQQPVTVLVPWLKKQPGVGFPIPLSGTLEKFIETAQLDFSGTTITANIDYDVVLDPNTHQPMKNGEIQFLAVETNDFLGDVFLCQDPNTGDLLRARMYSPVNNLLEWLEDHPGAYQNCGIIIRYSPFGNFADFITSLQNGVRVSVTQGGGGGRVNDVTLFVPGQ